MSDAARSYTTLNVGFPPAAAVNAHDYGALNVGFRGDNDGGARGYGMMNLTTGVGIALYPWREDPARLPRVRR